MIKSMVIALAAFLAAGIPATVFAESGAVSDSRSGGLISPPKAKSLLASDKKAVLLDVRTPQEFNDGHIAGSVLLPYSDIDEASAAKAIPTKDTVVVVYCRSGRRSAIAATELRKLGYITVWDLGGIIDWPYGVMK
jgi:phage shock protein E